MDLLEQEPPIDLHDKSWRICARNDGLKPQYIAEGALLSNCLVTEGCEVLGEVNHSILSSGVRVEKGAKIIDSVIMPGAVIGENAVVRRAIVAENAVVSAGATVGDAEGKIAVVGIGVTVPGNHHVAAGEQFEP